MSTNNNYSEQQLCSIWNFKFKNSMIHKAPYTKRWLTYLDAYKGDYFKNLNIPDYKSNMISNYIFSIVETIRPIMLDNDPKFQSLPRQSAGMEFSTDVQEALTYEWDRENMNPKLYRELINVLVLGTAIFFIPWNSQQKNVKGIPINPFNFFVDPLATSLDDAEYVIYANYVNETILKRLYPEKADKLKGGSINYSELVLENDKNAMIDNQILVLEINTKDYEVETKIDGDEKITKNLYPKGRVLTLCPELGVVLEDKHNPYDDGEFPFEIIKDYDIPGKFWGEGEVAQLISPQKHMNDLNNAIIDNAKTTANMPWIIDKNAGIPFGKITGRPGLIIRKNPGSEVRREQPPQMPMYVTNAVDVFKQDINSISGVYDPLKGEGTTGVYTAQGILALQEAGQSRIRLKVKLMEHGLGRIAQKWFSRMRQFWKDDRWISVTNADGSYNIKQFTKSILNYDYNIKITAGSTMPVNRSAMLDLMIRLAQTPMPDGQNLVDREAVSQYLPSEIKSAMLKRMGEGNQTFAQIQQQVDQLTQQLQQFAQQDQQDDKQTISVIEEITASIEKLNQQILQLQSKHDKIEKDKIEEEKIAKIKEESYNEGYKDLEKIYQNNEQNTQTTSEPLNPTEVGVENPNGINNGLPDEILSGLENMSDDELALLMQSNPEILDLLKDET